MSLTAVRSYFRTRMNSLNHSEWKDGFNFENIPETIQDRSYHIDANNFTGNGRNQVTLDASAEVTIRLFIKGFRDPASGIDEAISFANNAICDIIKPENANAYGNDIKNVEFTTLSIEPRSASNDNTVMAVMNFSVRLFVDTTL